MKRTRASTTSGSITEMKILPDGRILVHNLTPMMAAILAGLNPADEQMRLRADAPGACAAESGGGPEVQNEHPRGN